MRDLAFALTVLIITVLSAFAKAPVIVIGPASTRQEEGKPLTLSVKALGTEPLTYTWKKNGQLVQQSSSPNYLIADFCAKSDSGEYSVEVSNPEGAANSWSPPAIAPSEEFTLFIKQDGTLWATGRNHAGQLGTGNLVDTLSPVRVASSVVRAATGLAHSVYITTDSTLWSTGLNSNGQLLDGTTGNASLPLNTKIQATDLTAGISFTGYISPNFAPGGNSVGALSGRLTSVQKIVAGGDHVLFLDLKNQLWGSGLGSSGQLGSLALKGTVSQPVLIASDIVYASAGTYNSLYITNKGELWGTGINQDGQLGDQTFVNRTSPVLIDTDVIQVASGLGHIAYIKGDGTLWTNGANYTGQLGDGSLVNRQKPKKIADRVVQVACGRYTTFFVTAGGDLYACGSNKFGQLGVNDTTLRNAPVLVASGLQASSKAIANITITEEALKVNSSIAPITLPVGHKVFAPRIDIRYPDNRIFRGPLVLKIADPEIASVSEDGIIQGIKLGNTGVTATFGGRVVASIPLTVTSNPLANSLAGIDVTVPKTSIVISEAIDINVAVSTKDGSLLSNSTGITISSNEGRITVIGNQLVGARGGVARVLVSAGEYTKELKLDVEKMEWNTQIDSYLATPANGSKVNVGVVVINYYPTNNGIDIDTDRAPSFYSRDPVTIKRIKLETIDKLKLTKFAAEEGTKYHAYGDPNVISYAGFKVVRYYNYYEIPLVKYRSSDIIPLPDYDAIFSEIGLRDLVDSGQVKEVWFSARPVSVEYPVVKNEKLPSEFFMQPGPESNMSSPTSGDISNSDRSTNDLPVYNKTYVVYGFNLHRTHAENTHNRGHQIEAQLGYLDYLSGLEVDKIFWKYFVAHPFTGHPGRRSGDTHFPPNGMADYDYGNTNSVLSDIKDWKPTGGVQTSVNSDTWTTMRYSMPNLQTFPFNERDSHYKWLLFWFQSIPGVERKIPYQNGSITNWWDIIYNWDDAIRQKKALWANVEITGDKPTIAMQPSSQTISLGGNITFTVTANGNPSPTYQWYKDGVAIAGATGSSYTINNAKSTDVGTFTVVVANLHGSSTSNGATLKVMANPTALVSKPVVVAGKTVYLAIPGATTGTIRWQTSSDSGLTWNSLADNLSFNGVTTALLEIYNASSVLNNTQYRYQITSNGQTITSSVATLTVSAALFNMPVGLQNDGSGNIYIADAAAQVIRRIGTDQRAGVFAGTPSTMGSSDSAPAKFNEPTGLVLNTDGSLIVTDTGNSSLRKVDSSGAVSTFAGVSGSAGAVDGAATTARFGAPVGITRDSSGKYYVADQTNHTIRMVSSAGVVTTLAGRVGEAGTADGTGAAARFNLPTGIVFTPSGELFVSETNNHTIRKVTLSGVVTTFAGSTGNSGSADGAGSSSRFNKPSGLAIDSAGSLYVADTGNHTIRKVTSAGNVSTLAGYAGSHGLLDGTGSSAWFDGPEALMIDTSGNVYVSDTNNAVIRKIATDGSVTTLALYGAAPVILNQPAARTVTAGSSASFSVTSVGDGTLAYQWKKDGNNIAGANSTNFSITSTSSSDAGSYTVAVSNSFGTTISTGATLTVTSAVAVPAPGPASGGGGGGGGGGAPSWWMVAALVVAASARFVARRKNVP